MVVLEVAPAPGEEPRVARVEEMLAALVVARAEELVVARLRLAVVQPAGA
jgi:hypothetical protein